jgi:hypothetical protein
VEKIGELTTENVEILARKVREDEQLRNEALDSIQRDVKLFFESTFDLTSDQAERIRPLEDPPFAEIVAHAFSTAIRNDWKIEIAEELHEPPNMMVSIFCILDLCGVRFYF